MLNYIFAQRNAYGVAQRKIAQIFKQEGDTLSKSSFKKKSASSTRLALRTPSLLSSCASETRWNNWSNMQQPYPVHLRTMINLTSTLL